MNKFSDFTDIDIPPVTVKIKLSVISDNGAPDAWISFRSGASTQTELFDSSITYEFVTGLLSPLGIDIGMKNKQYSNERETAIVITSLTIDNFEIIPNWTNLAKYVNDHNETTPTSYLGFNGVWTLDIPDPFYHWKHRITGQGWLLQP